MKNLVLVLCLIVALVGGAFAQSQYQNPTYIPPVSGPQTSYTTAGDYYFSCNGASEFSINVAGTFTGLAATVRVTNDLIPAGGLGSSNTWTAVGVMPVGSFPAGRVTSLAATGTWKGNCAGYTGVNVHITAVSTGTAKVRMMATSGTPFSSVAANMSGDPCADPNVPKSVAIINIGAATTTKIVDTSASTVVYACSFQMTLAGTTPTFVFVKGTHTTTDCDTGAANLSGTYAPVSGSQLSFYPGGATIMKTGAGGQLCGTTAGTGSSAQGLLVYVQQ